MSLLPCESNQESVAPGLAPCEWQWKVNYLSAERDPGSAWNISTSNGGTEIYASLFRKTCEIPSLCILTSPIKRVLKAK